MKEGTENFRKWWFTIIKKKEKTEMKDRIAEACRVRHTTVSNWISGACAIPPLAQDKIEEVIGEKIFD